VAATEENEGSTLGLAYTKAVLCHFIIVTPVTPLLLSSSLQ